MNKLSTDRRAALVSALVEGNSVRATARMTDTAFNTVVLCLTCQECPMSCDAANSGCP